MATRRRRARGFYTHELLHEPGGSREHERALQHAPAHDVHRDHQIFGFRPYVDGVHFDDLANLPLHEIKRRFESEFGPDLRRTPEAGTPGHGDVTHLAECEADQLGARLAVELPPGQALGAGSLPRPVQTVAERRLGVDLSGVELRTEAQGEAKALRHSAFAVTEGSSIHFAKGQANLASEHGRKLLGHELAHVAQARAGAVPAGVAQARSFPRIHEEVLQELVRAKGKDPSFSRVKSLLGGLSKEDAHGLFLRLTSGSKKDDFAVYFNRDANVPADLREELIQILRRRFGAAAGAMAQANGPIPGATASDPEPATSSGPRKGGESSVGSATFGANPPLDAFSDWSYDVNFEPGREGEFAGFSPFITLAYDGGKTTVFDLRELQPLTLGPKALGEAWHNARLTPEGLFRAEVLNHQTAPNLHALLEHIRNEIWPAYTMELMKVGFITAFGVVTGTLGTISRPTGGDGGSRALPRRRAPAAKPAAASEAQPQPIPAADARRIVVERPNEFSIRSAVPGDPRAVGILEPAGNALNVTSLFRGAQPSGAGSQLLAALLREVGARPGQQLVFKGIINQETLAVFRAGGSAAESLLGKVGIKALATLGLRAGNTRFELVRGKVNLVIDIL